MTTAETRAACLDPETLAAWMDGALSRTELASAEAHAATCPRCQAMVAAMAKTAPPVVQTQHSWRRFLVPVLLPLTALLVVAMWVARPDDTSEEFAQPKQMARADESDRDARSQAPESKDSSGAAQLSLPAPQLSDERARTQMRIPASPPPTAAPALEQSKPMEAPAAVAPPPSPPPAAAAEASRAAANLAQQFAKREEVAGYSGAASQSAAQSGGAMLDVIAPEPSPGWRLNNDRIERSTDGGASWNVVYSEADAGLAALSSPSPEVCWVVGRAGIVLLTTDGRTWKRVSFPKTNDLASVLASDASHAVVTSSEGTVWVTKNGGQTWEAPKR